MLKHECTNHSAKTTTGKYACKEGMSSHNNYGTDTFTNAKRTNRHQNKQALKNIQYEDFDTDC